MTPSHKKILKHYKPDLSVKCVRCLNHNLQQDPSKKPSESPTTATVTVRPRY